MSASAFSRRTLAFGIAAALALAGTAQAADRRGNDADVGARLAIATPAGYKTASGPAAQWKIAEPQDAALRAEWWREFGDPALDALIADGFAGNATLEALIARLDEARARARLTDAARRPQLGLELAATRSGGGGQSVREDYRAQGLFHFELDLFGRLRKTSRAQRLDAEAQGLSLEAARTALAVEIARNWFALQGLDREHALLAQSVALREDGLRLTEQRLQLGDATELDSTRARAELSGTRAELAATERERGLVENELALLTGRIAGDVRIAGGETRHEQRLPTVPVGLPSTLLERRPDVAAAQRKVLAAQQRIGAAKAAYFPDLGLNAAGGTISSQLSDLFKWDLRSWLLGPLLRLPIFDGGARKADVRAAQAAYEAAIADYRQQALIAFRDVENGLLTLETLAEQRASTAEAATAADRALELSRHRYRNGFISHFELIDAQRTALAAQRNDVRVRTAQAEAHVGLIQALGGGWTAERSASSSRAKATRAVQ
jgi:multidrug efflux system outer membrane protein